MPGSRIVIFLIFANFGPRKIGYQRCFRPEKRQNGKKMEIYASHTTPGLARVCAGGHAVRAAWTLRHGLLMRAGLTVLSANTCGAGHLLTRHLLKRHPIVRRVRLGGAESACSFPRLPTPA